MICTSTGLTKLYPPRSYTAPRPQPDIDRISRSTSAASPSTATLDDHLVRVVEEALLRCRAATLLKGPQAIAQAKRINTSVARLLKHAVGDKVHAKLRRSADQSTASSLQRARIGGGAGHPTGRDDEEGDEGSGGVLGYWEEACRQVAATQEQSSTAIRASCVTIIGTCGHVDAHTPCPDRAPRVVAHGHRKS